jgi:NADPH:quinone reductase
MKAVQFRHFGSPDELEYVEAPTPSAGNDNALIQVKSASVNPSDLKNVSGQFKRTTLPRIPGRDFSGVVVEGPAAWLDAEVWGTGGDLGSVRDGTHAQFIEVPVAALVRKPSTLSHEQASTVGVTFLTAWLGAVEYGRLSPRETVAVIGASGGVGTAVAQIAKAKECRVIGIDRHPPGKDSPAARVVDDFVLSGRDTKENFARVCSGADLVFDTVGGLLFETALDLARRRGRVVEISATGKRRVEFDVIDFYHNETVLIGVDSVKFGVADAARVMSQLVDGFEKGTFRAPTVAKRFDLEDARLAYEAVGAGTQGKVVLNP